MTALPLRLALDSLVAAHGCATVKRAIARYGNIGKTCKTCGRAFTPRKADPRWPKTINSTCRVSHTYCSPACKDKRPPTKASLAALRRDMETLEALEAGESIAAIAHTLKVSCSRVKQILDRARRRRADVVAGTARLVDRPV